MYNSILIIVSWLTKIGHYQSVKVTINTADLAKVFLNLIMQFHSFLDFIIYDRISVFILKYDFCYATSLALSNIFSLSFYLQSNDQNLTLSFANFKQNNWIFFNLLTICLAELVIKNEGNNCTIILLYNWRFII